MRLSRDGDEGLMEDKAFHRCLPWSRGLSILQPSQATRLQGCGKLSSVPRWLMPLHHDLDPGISGGLGHTLAFEPCAQILSLPDEVRVLFFPKIAGARSFLFKTSACLCWLALERTRVGHGGMLEPGCLPSFCIPLFDFFWVSFLSLSFS